MTDQSQTTAAFELERGLSALYLEAPASVVEDITKRANAAVDEARAAERERCAKIAESIGDEQTDLHYVVGRQIAAKIRSGE